MMTAWRTTFHLNISTTLPDAARSVAEAWRRVEADEAVLPAKHLDFLSWGHYTNVRKLSGL